MVVRVSGRKITLSGTWRTNQWNAIRTAVVLLMAAPGGIVVECSEVGPITEEGAETFVVAQSEALVQGWPVRLNGIPIGE